MPGSLREVSNAEEEGVTFEWLAAPRSVLGDASGVSGVRAIRMRLGAPDASGRQSPEEIEGGDFERPAQLVIKALGFEPENLPELFAASDLKTTRWGTVKADVRHQMTNLDGVFAAGDIVRGASLVVWAIKDGRDAADAMHRYLQAKVSAPALIAAE
jgi:glutamate synthase (NADPH/NADH) small chain